MTRNPSALGATPVPRGRTLGVGLMVALGWTGPIGESSALPPDPSVPAAAPGLACTGTTGTQPMVLCVDGSASATVADGSAEQPYASIGDALVAGGEYAERIELAGVNDLQLVGGFSSGDFSQRDPEAFETGIRGGRRERGCCHRLDCNRRRRLPPVRRRRPVRWVPRRGWRRVRRLRLGDVAIVGNHIDGNVDTRQHRRGRSRRWALPCGRRHRDRKLDRGQQHRRRPRLWLGRWHHRLQ